MSGQAEAIEARANELSQQAAALQERADRLYREARTAKRAQNRYRRTTREKFQELDDLIAAAKRKGIHIRINTQPEGGPSGNQAEARRQTGPRAAA